MKITINAETSNKIHNELFRVFDLLKEEYKAEELTNVTLSFNLKKDGKIVTSNTDKFKVVLSEGDILLVEHGLDIVDLGVKSGEIFNN